MNVACIVSNNIGIEAFKNIKAILSKLSEKYNFDILLSLCTLTKRHLSTDDLLVCKNADSVIYINTENIPISHIKKELQLYANIEKYTDFLKYNFTLVSENYTEKQQNDSGFRMGKFGREAYDTFAFSELEIERIARTAYELCNDKKCLINIDDTSKVHGQLFRKILHDVNEDYPYITLNDLTIENAIKSFVNCEYNDSFYVTTSSIKKILTEIFVANTNDKAFLSIADVNDSTFGLFESRFLFENSKISTLFSTLYSFENIFIHSFDRHDIAIEINAILENILANRNSLSIENIIEKI